MRRVGSIVVAIVATVATVNLVGLPSAGAAPVPFSSTPLAGWSTNGTVRAVLVVGETVYAGGDFTQVRSGTQTLNRARLAAWDVRTGAIRTGFSADTNSTVRVLASDGIAGQVNAFVIIQNLFAVGEMEIVTRHGWTSCAFVALTPRISITAYGRLLTNSFERREGKTGDQKILYW